MDSAGNWTNFVIGGTFVKERTHNAVNEMTSIDGVSSEIEHDAAGNMVKISVAGDETNSHYACTWDAWNRLIKVETDDATPVTIAEYRYDGDWKRIEKVANSTTNEYYYDGWNMVQEHIVSTNAATNTYVWGIDLSGSLQGAGGIGGLVAWTQVTTSETSTCYYAYDANGNVMRLLDASDGFEAAAYEYNPYGTVFSSSGAKASVNAYRSSTKPLDAETDLYYYGLRFLNPGLGRFVSRDPIRERGGINLLEFVHNHPIGNVDYLGRSPRAVIIIGGIVIIYAICCLEDIDVTEGTRSDGYLDSEGKCICYHQDWERYQIDFRPFFFCPRDVDRTVDIGLKRDATYAPEVPDQSPLPVCRTWCQNNF